MNSRNLRLFFLAVFACVFTSGVFAEVTCQFKLTRGTASLVKAKDANPIPVGTEIVQVAIGDKIKSGPETRGELTFPDGSVFRVKSETELELQNEAVKLQVGETFFQVQKQGRSFQVVTPSSVCGVLGTSFDVNVNPMGATRVRVFDGVVAVRNHQDRERRQILLKAGQMVEAQVKGPLPKAPQGFDPKKVVEEERKSEAAQTRDPLMCQGKATKDPRTCPLPPNVPGMAPGKVTFDPGVCGAQGAPDPNMFPGKPTADPRACKGGVQPNMVPGGQQGGQGGPPEQPGQGGFGKGGRPGEGGQDGRPGGTQPTQDPRMCAEPTQDPRLCAEPTRDPRLCSQPTKDPRLCGPGTQDPRTCGGKPTADPHSCQGDMRNKMIPGGGFGTQDPRTCGEKPTSDPRSCKGGDQPNMTPGPRPSDSGPRGQNLDPRSSGKEMRQGSQTQPQGQQPSGQRPADGSGARPTDSGTRTGAQ